MRAVDRGRNNRLENVSALARVQSLILRRASLSDSGHLGMHRCARTGLSLRHRVGTASGTPAAVKTSISSVQSRSHGHRVHSNNVLLPQWFLPNHRNSWAYNATLMGAPAASSADRARRRPAPLIERAGGKLR
jgi:hypothetical protein